MDTEDGKITAKDHEVFIAGPDKDEKSPDISLTQGMAPVKSVKVKYSLLEIVGSDTPAPAERTFATAQEAQDNINEEKNANRILGSVSIEVKYDAASSGSAAAVVTAENKKISYIDIPVTKHWVDNPDWQGTKRSDIIVRLYRDGLEIDSATLQGGLPSPSGEDKILVTTFKNLPTCDATGKDYVYTIKEDEVTSPTTIGVPYTTTYSEDGKGGFVVKNEWVQGSYFNLIGQKAWSDYTPSTRPEAVQIILKRDGELFSTITTNAALHWRYSFTNLPKWKEKDKVLYSYTLEEASVSGYTSFKPVTVPLTGATPDAGTITIVSKDTTNTFNNDIVKVDGDKVWKGDQASDRPASVGVTLMQNGKVFKTATITVDSGWKYSFTALPKYTTNGKEYIYTVKETAVPEGYLTSVEGTTITNKKIPSTRVSVEKVWKDNGGFTGPWPDITIRLLQNGKEINHATLHNGTTMHTFQNLPTTDAAGVPYDYKVTEDPVVSSDSRKGYKTTIEGTVATGFTITNTWTEEDLVNIAGKKGWEGDEQFSEKERPVFVTLLLYRDGAKYAEKIVTAGVSNLWEYTFTNLPKHKEGATDELSKYTIKELSVPGYETSDYPEIDLKNIQNGQTFENANITNSFMNNAAKVEGQKAWSGDTLADRPNSVEVALLQNGAEMGKTATVIAPKWKYSFTNLPKYDVTGKAYTYTVQEANVPNGYSAKVDGSTITNTKIPLISVKGTKHWVDNKGWTGNRPKATIHLLRDGVVIPPDQGGEVVLPESHTSGPETFTYEFNNLPMTDQTGREYVYTVTEEPIKSHDDPEGYVSSIVGYNITNTWVKGALFNISGEKAWSDFEDAEGMRPNSVNMVLKQNGIEIAHAPARSDNGWAYDFKLLPKWADDAKKELYAYTIEEQAVEGYESFAPVDVPTADVVDKSTVVIESGKTTNTLINALTKIEGEKLWNDFDNAGNSRPDAIMVSVLQNGVKLEGVSATASAPEWTYSVEGLPKYYTENNTVKQYVYSVQEAVIPDGYVSEVGIDGTTITNTFVNDIVSIALEKKWVDTGKEADRPKAISVSLLQNGNELQKIELSETNTWKTSVQKLPKYNEEGVAYEYAVKEDSIAGYELTDQTWVKAADGNSWLGTFTNTKIDPNNPPEPKPLDPDDSKKPKPLVKTGDALAIPLLSLLAAAVAGGVVLLLARRRRREKLHK